jgi:hypothetical protein
MPRGGRSHSGGRSHGGGGGGHGGHGGGHHQPQQMQQPVKMCTEYARYGRCSYGDKCRYSHGQALQPQPQPQQQQQQMYGGWGAQQPVQQGWGQTAQQGWGQPMQQQQQQQQHQQPHRQPSQQVCRYYAATGTCKYGSNCHYSHSGPPGGYSQGVSAGASPGGGGGGGVGGGAGGGGLGTMLHHVREQRLWVFAGAPAFNLKGYAPNEVRAHFYNARANVEQAKANEQAELTRFLTALAQHAPQGQLMAQPQQQSGMSNVPAPMALSTYPAPMAPPVQQYSAPLMSQPVRHVGVALPGAQPQPAALPAVAQESAGPLGAPAAAGTAVSPQAGVAGGDGAYALTDAEARAQYAKGDFDAVPLEPPSADLCRA